MDSGVAALWVIGAVKEKGERAREREREGEGEKESRGEKRRIT